MIQDLDFIQHITLLNAELGLPVLPMKRSSVVNLSGNINRVRRVVMDFGDGGIYSFVVKHLPAGGKLEKYPAVTFPESRLAFEAAWISAFEETGIVGSVRPPRLLHHDDGFRTLIFEDLGEKLSLGKALELDMVSSIGELGQFLGAFHGLTSDNEPIFNPAAEQNRPFVLTFPLQKPEFVKQLWMDNGGDLALVDELVELQQWFVGNYGNVVLEVLIEMSEEFKTSRFQTLTHGDLHGESILVLSEGSFGIVDAELCDTGSAGFDVGTVIAHIWAHRAAIGEPDSETFRLVTTFLQNYENGLRQHVELEPEAQRLLRVESLKYAGAEILRRTIGAAVFPCLGKIADKQALLLTAKSLVLEPEFFAKKLSIDCSDFMMSEKNR